MFFKLLIILLGYVNFTIKGEYVVRFINLLSKSGPRIFFLKQITPGVYSAACKPKDFSKLLPSIRATGVKVTLTKKRGIPFTAHRYRKRTGLIVGVLIFGVLIWVMSLFIWNIDVVGIKTIPKEKLLQSLESYGIYEGINKSAIDTSSIKEKMLKEYPELSFFSLNIQGSHLVLEVREGVRPPILLDESVPCDIIARSDGQLVEIKAYQGSIVKRIGDTVKAGDIIVSGIFENVKTGLRFVHARADIKARTLRIITIDVPLEEEVEKLSGNVKERKTLKLFNIEIPLFFNKNKVPFEFYQQYELRNEQSFMGIELPFCLISTTFLETIKEVEKRTLEEAQAIAREKLRLKEELELNSTEICDKRIQEKQDEIKVTIIGEYDLLENIGIEKSIVIN